MIKFFSFRFHYRMLCTFMSSVRKFAAQWKRTTLGAFTVRKKKFIATGFLCIYSLVNQINWTAKSILYSIKIIDYRNFDVTALHLLHWFCKPRCKSKELPTTTKVKRAASSGRFIIVGVEDWIVEKTSSSPVVCKSSEIHFLFCGTGIIYDEFKRPLLLLRY